MRVSRQRRELTFIGVVVATVLMISVATITLVPLLM